MSKSVEVKGQPLNPEDLRSAAIRLHQGIEQSISSVQSKAKEKTGASVRSSSPDDLFIGNDKNFIRFSGIGTEQLKVTVGKTPVELPGHNHMHLDVHHLLHPMDLFRKDQSATEEEGSDTEKKKDEFSPFDVWQASVRIGENPWITYSANSWEMGMVEDQESGKVKKAVVVKSVSGGIQDNNMPAVEGIETLIPHLS